MISNRRPVVYYSLLTFLLMSSVMPVAAGNGGPADFCEQVKPCQLLAKSDAERILGQSVRLTKDAPALKTDVRQCLCAYTGASTDNASEQPSLLFFSLEQKTVNPSAEQARQVLVSTKQANEHDTTIWDLKGVGDEAILFSSDSDSHFVMARKGSIIMRLQVKRAAGTKSLDEIKAFAEKVSKQF